MGRKGDPARSKTRPSSSSMAASLLQGSAAAAGFAAPAAGGFGGYMGSARVDSPAASFSQPLAPSDSAQPASDAVDVPFEVDGEATAHLRKLSKKDPTTKVKALAALAVTFGSMPAVQLQALLPSWAFEYRRLTVDSNRQVRENAHAGMEALARSIGRGLAVHIRGLMGAWWVALFDPSKEVAAAARRAFQAAFAAKSKQVEALAFCSAEIVAHIDDNLKLTPQTVAADRSTPPEEAAQKLDQVQSASLLALASLLDVLLASSSPAPPAPPGAGAPPREAREAEAEAEAGGPTPAAAVSAELRARVEERVLAVCAAYQWLRAAAKSKSPAVRSAAYQLLH
eukprot:jgi/Mesen1/10317/ME000079S09730